MDRLYLNTVTDAWEIIFNHIRIKLIIICSARSFVDIKCAISKTCVFVKQILSTRKYFDFFSNKTKRVNVN